MNGGGFCGQKSVDSIDSSAGVGGGGVAGENPHPGSDAEEVWLECDDETIHVMSKRQLLVGTLEGLLVDPVKLKKTGAQTLKIRVTGLSFYDNTQKKHLEGSS